MLLSLPKGRCAAGLLAGLAMTCLASSTALAGTYTILHQFTGGADGAAPASGVTLDRSGNMYGTTAYGGASATSDGTVFKSDPQGNITTLHSFNGDDGSRALDGPLALIGQTLFGGTTYGGPGGSGGNDAGVLFSIKTDGTDFTVLHDFSGPDGARPIGPLRHIPGLGLVGVASNGGFGSRPPVYSTGKGVLFSFYPNGSFRTLHHFDGTDGDYPNFIVNDASGTIYGSTDTGGTGCSSSKGCGVIYKFDPSTRGYTVLYQFTGGKDGSAPVLGSIGPDGTLYGATQAGKGLSYYGTLFELTPGAQGYHLTTLAYFNKVLGIPTSGPSLTPDGVLLVAATGGLYAFRGHAKEVLQAFTGSTTGYQPAQPTPYRGGMILGTAQDGGITPCVTTVVTLSQGCGVLYQYENAQTR
jgi:uncharacterized repeat protein (TIGR03803 family)